MTDEGGGENSQKDEVETLSDIVHFSLKSYHAFLPSLKDYYCCLTLKLIEL